MLFAQAIENIYPRVGEKQEDVEKRYQRQARSNDEARIFTGPLEIIIDYTGDPIGTYRVIAQCHENPVDRVCGLLVLRGLGYSRQVVECGKCHRLEEARRGTVFIDPAGTP